MIYLEHVQKKKKISLYLKSIRVSFDSCVSAENGNIVLLLSHGPRNAGLWTRSKVQRIQVHAGSSDSKMPKMVIEVHGYPW